jgi:hypothetical protein
VRTVPPIFTQTSSSSFRWAAVSPVFEATLRRHLASGVSTGWVVVLAGAGVGAGAGLVADAGVEAGVVGVVPAGATAVADGFVGAGRAVVGVVVVLTELPLVDVALPQPPRASAAPSMASARPSDSALRTAVLEPRPVTRDEPTALAADADLPAGAEHATAT